jgi:hypothetical protein
VDPILVSPVDVGDAGVVMAEAPSGLPVIALPSALTGLHYFDGQAMRDARLTAEQNYRRALGALAARAGGYGVASGLDVEQLTTDTLRISAGLAVDGVGRVLQLPAAQTISMAALVAASRVTPWAMEETSSTSPEFLRCLQLWTKRPASARASTVLWIVAASWTEAPGSVKSGTVTREGIRLRAVPLVLHTPIARSQHVALDARAHLRSLVAAAMYADEWASGGSLISGEGLRRGAWCTGAQLDDRREVPLAVVARAGEEILFVDEWMVRRERHEPPPSRYWAGLMRMRPWSAYLAQLLQFQCQLSDAGVAGGVLPSSGCDDTRAAITNAATYLSSVYALWQPSRVAATSDYTPQQRAESDVLLQAGGVTRLEHVTREIVTASLSAQHIPTDRLLIRHGIVELPPAGYLPVSVGNEQTVNAQVRALMGDGVDLRFCIVHPDVVAHELEAGQHMERISLLRGLDDPTQMPQVDIFVPDGVAVAAPPPTDRYEALARVATTALGSGLFGGAARREALPGGGAALHVALSNIVAGLVELLMRNDSPATETDEATAAAAAPPSDNALWITVRTDKSIRTLGVTQSAQLTGRAVLATDGEATSGRELTFDGQLTIRSTTDTAPDTRVAGATVVGTLAVIQRAATAGGDTAVLVSRRLSLAVEMRWQGDATRGTMTAKILTNQTLGLWSDPGQPLATVQKEWGDVTGRTSVAVLAFPALTGLFGDDALTTSMNTAPSFDETPQQFVVLELIENADVARAEQPLHLLANAALRNVQALLDTETTFTRDALAALFPPPPPPALLVQATHDWVLFRRRREQRHVPWREPLNVGTRRFRLLSVTVANDDDAKKLISSLRAPRTTRGGALGSAVADVRSAAPVFVEFPRDGVSPLVDPPALRAAFAALQPGKAIAAGIIASTGDEGPELLTRRLHALIPLLAPDTLVEAGASMIALATTPPDLVTLDAAGVILLITV